MFPANIRPLALLVKPVGASCNLDCPYCFYKRHAAGKMDLKLLERTLDSYMAMPFPARFKSVSLQGGEPLLAGAEVLELVSRYPCAKNIQTNATLLTPEIARGFARTGWLAGVSLDGPEDIHDKMRSSSHGAVVSGIRMLEEAGAAYNLMTVVSKANVAKAACIYSYFKNAFKTRFHQYIECTGPDPAFAITAEAWGDFLVELFDEWIKSDLREISIRTFDSLASVMLGRGPVQCSFSDTCAHHLVVEFDGSVYPCDFHVSEETRLGNIKDKSLLEIAQSEEYAKFAARKGEIAPECASCEYFTYCRGDCPRNRRSLCAGWKRFFAHALGRLGESIFSAD
ncbi:MAG: SPASM domain-containing protein [Kiritimatiellae bacterium]|nr:SPASM domain-containing protein [Kiritimatiellia bacterium]